MLINESHVKNFRGILVIGDVHGNFQEFSEALEYADKHQLYLVQLGDLVDYGSYNFMCILKMLDVVKKGHGVMVRGNHDDKLAKWLMQRREGEVRIKTGGGLSKTIAEFESLSQNDQERFETSFLELLNASHYNWVLGNLLFVHAAAHPSFWYEDKLSSKHRSLAIYGEVIDTDPVGYPIRGYSWVDKLDRTKENMPKYVFFGHDIKDYEKPTEIESSQSEGFKLKSKAFAVDTGCSKGGRLSGYHILFDKTLGIWLPWKSISFENSREVINNVGKEKQNGIENINS